MCSFFFNIINSDLESFIYLTDIKEQSYKEISQINKGCIYRRHTIRTTSNQADFNYKLRTTDQKTWKQPRRPLTDKWISKIESLCTKQYYSAKKGENLPYVTTWVSLEDIMLSELRHSPKHKCCWFYLYEILWVVNIIKTEKNGTVVARGWREDGGLLLHGQSFSFTK